MKMYPELSDLQKFTVQEFQADFDNLIQRVENGESFILVNTNTNIYLFDKLGKEVSGFPIELENNAMEEVLSNLPDNLQKQYNEDIVPLLKQKMYSLDSPRIRSYGWEQSLPNVFNINKYKIELLKKLGPQYSNIEWGEQISNLIDSTTNSNSLFA